jgi:hypothetical protein
LEPAFLAIYNYPEHHGPCPVAFFAVDRMAAKILAVTARRCRFDKYGHVSATSYRVPA